MSYNIFQLEIILLKVIRLFSLGERRDADGWRRGWRGPLPLPAGPAFEHSCKGSEQRQGRGGRRGGKVVAVSPNKQAKSAQKCWQTVSISISGEKLMATFLSTFQFIFARFFLELTTVLVVAAIEKLLPYADDACCLNGGNLRMNVEKC